MPTIPTIGNIGDRLDLRIKQGADFGPVVVTLTNPDNSPMDLTGGSVQGMVKKKPSDATPAATLRTAIVDAAAGKCQFWLTHADTLGIKAGAEMTDPQSAYTWDFFFIDSQGRRLPLLYGDALVFREVTTP
jgi:hypothetical protein